ncbi:hypothetical protein JXA47_15805 [Candidatus Sumerlaeota bacterium]|nr:hypothetical protein [Candidatus Sumerlaeota bacterium]
MGHRRLTIALALLVVVLLMLFALVAVQIFLAEPGSRAETAERWQPVMIALGIGVAASCLAALVLLLKGHAAEQAAHDAEAEEEFMRSILSEPIPTASPTPSPLSDPLPKAASQTTGGSPNDLLLKQLSMARLNPSIEGKVQEGPHSGATILRLGRDSTALVLTRPPLPEEWESLIPRHSRVFFPRAEGHWVCVESLEDLLRERLEISL